MSVRSSCKSCWRYELDELEVLEFPLRCKLQSLRYRRKTVRAFPDDDVDYRRGVRIILIPAQKTLYWGENGVTRGWCRRLESPS